jgi:hypothetical protein
VTHRGFADPDLAEAYRSEWHDTLIHIGRCHTRPSDPTLHREQQRRYLLARLLAAVDAVRRRRTGMGDDDAADAAGERPHSPGLRYFPVTLDGDVIGYLYASEGDDWASFMRHMASRHDTLAAAVEWSRRLDQAGNYGFSPLQALRHWVGKPEHPVAGGIAADAAQRWAPDPRTLEELGKPAAMSSLFRPPPGPGYRSSTDTPVSYRPVTRGSEVLGYLWASNSDDAASYLRRAAAGADGLRAGALWRARLAEAKSEGLTPAQALRRWVGLPGYLEFGGIAADADESEAPSLAALRQIARELPEGTPDRDLVRPHSTRPCLDQPRPKSTRQLAEEMRQLMVNRPSYRFLTEGPVRYRAVSRGGQVLGYLWACDRDNAADFVSRRDAGADGSYAKGRWIELLADVYQQGLTPSEALRHWVGAPEDPAGGGVSTEEHEAPDLHAVKVVAGRWDEEW